MKRSLVAIAAFALAVAFTPAALAAPSAKPDPKPKPPKLTTVKLLAFNDFHLEPGTPGTINDPVTGAAVPAGGASYFATHLKELRPQNPNACRLRRRPSVRARSSRGSFTTRHRRGDEHVGLDLNGVGNHEFDEGPDELERMQYGNRTGGGGPDGGTAYVPARADGCHPVDGCQDGTPFYGSVFQYLAANVTDTSTEQPAPAALSDRQHLRRARSRLRRRDSRGDAADRHANGRGRTRVPRRGRHGQRARRWG